MRHDLIMTETDLNHVYGQSFRTFDVDGHEVAVIAEYSGMRKFLADAADKWPVQVVLGRTEIELLMARSGAVQYAHADGDDGTEFRITSATDEADDEEGDEEGDESANATSWWSAGTAAERQALLDAQIYGPPRLESR